jgi:hypothetical protein
MQLSTLNSAGTVGNREVLKTLCERDQDEIEVELKPVLNLATEYLQ